ncbi:DUF697 domain-containing protein [Youngiibacter multivorans]|uniref:DUF697 domain-containing protein n=1 Tax=Youngiibacter multivorans TaxID=937251 RepID=A0ABS4G2M4_9CLOT|nr:DUF697 domain-containing protein [Youngiibacter multivorans]MBP1918771.1 hypothetical protein [Youngiibacter multivorans]
MDDTAKTIKKILVYVSLTIIFLVTISAVNQAASIYERASRIHPYFGYAVLALIIAGFLAIIFVPVAAFLGLKKRPEIPKSKESPEYPAYLEDLKQSLSSNRILKEKGFSFTGNEPLAAQIDKALAILGVEADKVVKSSASAVFVTTAISQNGSLDGVFVLASITRTVWDIAKIYRQRPGIRDLMYLYGNIGATVLAARGIEDLDLLDEQLEPILASVLGGGLGSLLPGAVHITNLIANSITEGSVNAMLSLRVGAMTKRYCASTVEVNRKVLRRSATLDAVSMLGGIIKENSAIIVSSFGKAAKSATRKLFRL